MAGTAKEMKWRQGVDRRVRKRQRALEAEQARIKAEEERKRLEEQKKAEESLSDCKKHVRQFQAGV